MSGRTVACLKNSSPNRAMAIGKVRTVTLLLLLANVLQPGSLQITCDIEIDSTQGLWREATPLHEPPSNTSYCKNYRYRETNLTCTSSECPRESGVDFECTVYYNADTRWPCLSTCKVSCKHRFACPRQGNCPCAEGNVRYDQAKMCIPIGQVLSCRTENWVDEGRRCFPVTCSNTCPNGRCDPEETCHCHDGFIPDSKSGKCVPKDCSEECVEGTCQTYGACTCQDGYKNNPNDKYKCDKIVCSEQDPTSYCQCQRSECIVGNNGRCDQKGECQCHEGSKKNRNDRFKCDRILCPDKDHNKHCQYQCEKSSCTSGGSGLCDQQGECKCNKGFKKDSNYRFKCNKIVSPDEDRNKYLQDQCKKSSCTSGGNGLCDQQGECKCNEGFKISPRYPYQCDKITCPSTGQYDINYCASQCNKHCQHGKCDNGGACTCSDGFKKESNALYKCIEIHCPSSDLEDHAYCKTRCTTDCKKGSCDYKGNCTCNNGFKKSTREIYQCDQIFCPSNAREDDVYCQTLCTPNCENGQCDQSGRCSCDSGFKKGPNSQYECVEIICPSTAERVDEWGYCKSVCEPKCLEGVCDGAGVCKCNEGFKKPHVRSYECSKIKCPASSSEDYNYCKAQCDASCTNGTCSERGVCGQCVVKCDGNLSCPPSKPRCSQHGFCTAKESQETDCTTECIAQCVLCDREECDAADGCRDENQTKDIATCSRNCISTWCELQSKNGEDRKWMIATLTILSVLVAIGIAVWVWRRRHVSKRGCHVAVTENLELGPTQGPSKRQAPARRECESYLEPRRLEQEPGGNDSQYPLYETVADFIPNVVGQGATEKPRHLQAADLTDPAAAVPAYMNFTTAEDNQSYENFRGVKNKV